ncbi:MAG: hypothetical protein ACREET_15590 [Stellaceae bacterium]
MTESKFPNEPAQNIVREGWELGPAEIIWVRAPQDGPGMWRIVEFRCDVPAEPSPASEPAEQSPRLAAVLDEIRRDDAAQEPTRGNDRER